MSQPQPRKCDDCGEPVEYRLYDLRDGATIAATEESDTTRWLAAMCCDACQLRVVDSPISSEELQFGATEQ